MRGDDVGGCGPVTRTWNCKGIATRPLLWRSLRMDTKEKLKWAATVVVATVLPLYVMYRSAATTSAKYVGNAMRKYRRIFSFGQTEQLALQEAAERREWLRMAAVHEKAEQKYSADPAERAKGEAELARPGQTL